MRIVLKIKRDFALCLCAVFSLMGMLDAWGDSGTEGASFLDIPVGARPAALGSAYSALATDGYAIIYNPAGLGYVKTNEFSATHLSYLSSMNYEFFSLAHPLSQSNAIGFGVQYFSPGSIQATDINGNSIGSINGHYGAYSFSFGQNIQEYFSFGITAKWVNAAIADVSGNAFAVDGGVLYKPMPPVTLAAGVANVGSKLRFVSQGDALPTTFRVGAAYRPNAQWILAGEGLYGRSGLINGRVGCEWAPFPTLSLRAGYRSDALKGLSPIAGLSMGMGINLWEQSIDYAWLPMGNLGNTQYFSLVIRFGEKTQVGRVLRKIIDNVEAPDY